MNQIFYKIHKKRTTAFDNQTTTQKQSLASSISSTMSYKFTRKQSTRKSLNSSSSLQSCKSSLERVNLGKFYVKMSDSKENNNLKETYQRISQIEKGSTQQKKRRQPTPIPRANHRAKIDKQKQLNQVTVEKQLQLLQLTNKLKGQKIQKQIMQRRFIEFDKQIKLKAKLNEELQSKIKQLTQKQNETVKKLTQYQQLAFRNQTNYEDAKSKLQKLKLTIKINRVNELQNQNKKIIDENNLLAEKCKFLEQEHKKQIKLRSQIQRQLRNLKQVNQQLKSSDYIKSYLNEIQVLKRTIEASKSDKEKILENVLSFKNEEEMRLRMKIQKLQININYINRRKNEQIGLLNEKKMKEINAIRQKLRVISDQCSKLKYQYRKLKNKRPDNESPSPNRVVKSRLTRTEDSLQFFKLELSP